MARIEDHSLLRHFSKGTMTTKPAKWWNSRHGAGSCWRFYSYLSCFCNPGWAEIFRVHPSEARNPPSLLCNECWVPFPGLKRPGRAADNLWPSSARVENWCSLSDNLTSYGTAFRDFDTKYLKYFTTRKTCIHVVRIHLSSLYLLSNVILSFTPRSHLFSYLKFLDHNISIYHILYQLYDKLKFDIFNVTC